jgi:hypothetical protein
MNRVDPDPIAGRRTLHRDRFREQAHSSPSWRNSRSQLPAIALLWGAYYVAGHQESCGSDASWVGTQRFAGHQKTMDGPLAEPEIRHLGLILLRLTRKTEPTSLSRIRLKVKTTSDASNGLPLWNLTPGRRWKVQVFKSSVASQLVARSGCTCSFGSCAVSRLKQL